MTPFNGELTDKEKTELKNLENILEKFRVQFEKCDYTYEREEFFGKMKEFWQFLSDFRDEKIFDLFQHTEYYSKHKEYFTSLENYFVRTIESVESVGILTKNIGGGKDKAFLKSFDTDIAKKTYLQTAREMQMVNFSNCKTLVMVGSGPMPETILYIYENTSIENIIGIDNNQEAVYMAGEIIRSQNINRIKFIHFNGIEYDYSDADIIYVANFVRPKREIFERIAETAKNNVQILTRTPVLFGKMLYEDTVKALPSRLSIIKEGDVNNFFLGKPLVIKKLDI